VGPWTSVAGNSSSAEGFTSWLSLLLLLLLLSERRYLNANNIRAAYYHAGMTPKQRTQASSLL
jgi:hypothetical protein